MKKSGITIKGHKGTWCVIGETFQYGKMYYLLGNEEYECQDLCVREDGSVFMEKVTNGIKEVQERLGKMIFSTTENRQDSKDCKEGIIRELNTEIVRLSNMYDQLHKVNITDSGLFNRILGLKRALEIVESYKS